MSLRKRSRSANGVESATSSTRSTTPVGVGTASMPKGRRTWVRAVVATTSDAAEAERTNGRSAMPHGNEFSVSAEMRAAVRTGSMVSA